MQKLKPVIVLSLIMTIVAALLIVTYNLTYVDKSGILTDELKEGCVVLCGEGEYGIVTDWISDGYAIEKPESVEKLIKKYDGSVIFEIVANGYSTSSLDLLVAMNNNGSVKGIIVVSNSDTPGIGTRIENENFLGSFVGADSSVTLVKTPPKSEAEVQAATGATYSSEGVVSAVNTAIETYKEMGAVK